ncbi:MAG: SUMF1/EgtB/PvdO family nonheme iron enzyme [Hydrotalea flava]|uniref:type IX secretion system lipoprotein PorK/GldK n=1 Tax=Hydrotalea TaxID=1004300 RepID=UPI00094590DC|nr:MULTISPECIES: SUMF1/EgtB/PvdO family nonheme iron enzyme [Hydrotalea]MBY0348164.1 SUMF1/EgtB/PvdO family nonheme iron enzyme [Hydrotalea flava]NIM35865.1 SUMF1/EgtB/PvdO family nonheme iron enzyme [Hydrotalea flava]NIM38717.1 SUMF1/EgtB/PvdO family nonheme iron enzyme [Hydrotalea flava]NIN03905.1 SUMF1/EgtB/PvdO family nonheme iron enzyme [Hydrotalea flava]NIN15626.1 SUMF1/EgtB/PvdO family nonheme iron enzyme [Hydrotalea flava]
MKKYHYSILLVSLVSVGFTACFKGKSKNPLDDGQLHGVAPGAGKSMGKPRGMVYIPPGTFHMGPSDEDINFNYTARNRQVSIPGFWMDATEITNNDYRQFVYWVRDSLAAKELGYYKSSAGATGGDSAIAIDWNKARTIKYDASNLEKLGNKLILAPDNRLYGKPDIDPNKLLYQVETFNLFEAAKRENAGQPRSKFIVRYQVPIYPDTLVWMRDFSYSYNEPMTKRYFAHPAFGNYPVVGVNWKQAVAFCHWRTHIQNAALERKKMAVESDYRLPSEAEWEYAARGGRTNSMYPWGNYYIRNKKGCLLANFKPGRGNYAEDGGFYTVRVDAYWPNDYGLYNMAGNVAEWTNSYFNESAYNFMSDMSPDVRYEAKDSDPPLMRRKVVRGGSWKDVGYFLQTSTRTFEYQDSAKSYIGFRCVIDLAPRMKK